MSTQIDLFSLGVNMSQYQSENGNFIISAHSLTHLLETHSYTEQEPTKEKKVKKTKKSEFINMNSHDIVVPDGWRYCGKSICLMGYAKDPDTGKNFTRKMKSFDDAVKKADELGIHCGGITMTSTGFSLRISTEPRINLAEYYNSGMASWIKTTSQSDADYLY